MKKIKSHRMEDGSLYKLSEESGVYYLELYAADGTNTIVTQGEIGLVEDVFNQKTGSPISTPAVTLSVEPEIVRAEPSEFDCPKDPCAFPDCDCDPVVAPTEPQPFGE